jgi:hypothetical protein
MHTGLLFAELGILPFEKIIYLNKALFMDAIEYGYETDSLNKIWP